MADSTKFFFQIYSGNNTESESLYGRAGSLAAFPPSGQLLQFNSASDTGFSPISVTEVVNQGLSQGAVLVASSISLLTQPGQLLTSDGVNNFVLDPPSVVGQVLRYNPSVPGSLDWAPASSVSGVVQPTPSTIALRDGVGAVYGAGFVTYGLDILPSFASTCRVGSSAVPFLSMQAISASFGSVATSSVTSTSSLVLSGVGGASIRNGNVELVSIQSGAVNVVPTIQATSGVVLGGSFGAAGTWLLNVVAGQLTFQVWNGSAYVTAGTIAST
jgi:hypothetical protein